MENKKAKKDDDRTQLEKLQDDMIKKSQEYWIWIAQKFNIKSEPFERLDKQTAERAYRDAVNAIQRIIPQKVIVAYPNEDDDEDYFRLICPHCHLPVGDAENYKDFSGLIQYCGVCGQRLDWDFEEDKEGGE